MKLIGCLYKLAKGCDFRTLELIGQVQSSTYERWFHRWVEWMAEGTVYFEHVRPWRDADELRKGMQVYEKLGFPGVLGSVVGKVAHMWCTRCTVAW